MMNAISIPSWMMQKHLKIHRQRGEEGAIDVRAIQYAISRNMRIGGYFSR
jgi:hypothetical protein